MRAWGIATLLLLSSEAAAEPTLERVTVSSVKQFATSAYPTVDRLADGRLLCVFSAIDTNATGGKAVIVGMLSADHGRTWSKPSVLIDSRPDLDYNPNIIVIGSRVIVTSTTVPPTHAQFISTSRTIAVRNDDNGKTWSKPYEIPMGHRCTSGKINRRIVLRDGTALFAYSWDITLDGSEKLASEGEEECVACVSAVDVWKGAAKPRVDIVQHEANLRDIVRVIRARGARPILMTPNPVAWTSELRQLYGKAPYRPDDPDGWNVLLKDCAETVRRLSADEKVLPVDVDRLFREYAAAQGHRLHDLLADGMHPNDKGHQMIADRLWQVIKTLWSEED